MSAKSKTSKPKTPSKPKKPSRSQAAYQGNLAAGNAELTLTTPDQVVAMVRQQVEQARMSQSPTAGGESHA